MQNSSNITRKNYTHIRTHKNIHIHKHQVLSFTILTLLPQPKNKKNEYKNDDENYVQLMKSYP